MASHMIRMFYFSIAMLQSYKFDAQNEKKWKVRKEKKRQVA